MAQWPCGRCASPKGPPSAGVGGPAAARRACARNLHFRVGKCAPGGGPCRARDIFWATPISSRRERSTWRLSAPRAKLSRGARTIFYKFQPTVANCLARRAGDCREGSLPFHLERARIYFARSAAVGVCFVRRSVAVTRARCVMFSVYILGARSALNGLRDVQFPARSALNGLHGLQLGARSALNSCQCLQLGARSALNGYRYLQFGARSSLGGLTIFPGRRAKRAERFATCTVRRAKRAKRFTASTPLRRARGRWTLTSEFAASPSPSRSGPAACAGASGVGGQPRAARYALAAANSARESRWTVYAVHNSAREAR